MTRNIFAVLLSATAISMASVVPVAAESFNYLFNINLGIAKIGEMRVKATNGGGQYTASGALYTTGITGALYDVRFDSDIKGRVANTGQLLPGRYTSKSNEDGKISHATIRYSGNKVSKVVFDPQKHIAPDATSQRNTLDPMSLIYLLLRPVSMDHICGGQFALFDGQVRMKVTFTNARKFSDGRVQCSVAYAGANGQSGGIVPTSVTYVPRDNGLMYIAGFSAKTNIGTLTATLR